jgi:hypothetical protein
MLALLMRINLQFESGQEPRLLRAAEGNQTISVGWSGWGRGSTIQFWGNLLELHSIGLYE